MVMNRRQFLQRVGGGAGLLGSAAGVSSLMTLAGTARAASSTSMTGHKALVCVYLAGGSDNANMLVPAAGQAYTDYQAVRPVLAVPQSGVLAVTPRTANVYPLGFHPSMLDANRLFTEGKLSAVANVGTLRQPVTVADKGNLALFPSNLFSHNDQTAHWLRGALNTSVVSGWAGRMADMVLEVGGLSPAYSLAGNTQWMVGQQSNAFVLSSAGVVSFKHGHPTLDALGQQALDGGELLEQVYADLALQINTDVGSVKAALDSTLVSSVAVPSGNSLAAQLAAVAKLIQQHEVLGQTCQTFFVQLGGFDTHDFQPQRQPVLLGQVSAALGYFEARLQEMGMFQNVTTFTMSEFGRTLSNNGDGTDHGWGSHHLVMGGSVMGGDVLGTMPGFAVGSPEHYDRRGILIPDLATEQYFAPLLRWFGLSAAEVATVLPGMGNFDADALAGMMV